MNNNIPSYSELKSFYAFLTKSNSNIYSEWYTKKCEKEKCPICLNNVINDSNNVILCKNGHIATCVNCVVNLKKT